jgi:hypothetical protein
VSEDELEDRLQQLYNLLPGKCSSSCVFAGTVVGNTHCCAGGLWDTLSPAYKQLPLLLPTLGVCAQLSSADTLGCV